MLNVSTTARHMLLDLRIWYISISAMIASGLHLPITHSKQVLKKIWRTVSNSTRKVLLRKFFYILFKQPIELYCMFLSLSCDLSLIILIGRVEALEVMR